MTHEHPTGLPPRHPQIQLPDDVQVAIYRALRFLDEFARCVHGEEPVFCMCSVCARTIADVLGEIHVRYRSESTPSAPQITIHRDGSLRIIPAPCTQCAMGHDADQLVMDARGAVDVCRGCRASDAHGGGDDYVN